MKVIPYGRQNIEQDDIGAVVKTLTADFLTQGPKVKEFENKFAAYVGAKYAVAVNNATSGLHLAVLALGLKEGERVITTPITFAASANCVRYAGGEIWFADIDSDSYLLSLNKTRALIESKPKGFFKGIIPVDFAGLPVNLELFRELADEHNLWIIEDACHAPGGSFVDSKAEIQNCGNSIYADLAIFSFHPVKHIACGEGGMVTTNDKVLYKKLLELRTHGITKNKSDYINSVDFANGNINGNSTYPAWYMEMQNLGFNYRLTDFQAALGISQLQRADEGILRRREIAAAYKNAFSGESFINGQSGVVDGHAYHLYIIEVQDRLGLYNYLRENKILTQIHYIPCHLMPYYKQFGWKKSDMPKAENYYKNCISLPMYPNLCEEDLNYVIKKVINYYHKI